MTHDLAVVFSPVRAWPRAIKASGGHWLSRYLLLMLVAGCSASLMTTGHVTLRIALPCMLYAAVAPMLQIASLAVVRRGALPLRRAAALFAISNVLWMATLLFVAALWAWGPATQLYHYIGWIRNTLAGLLVAWSAYVDYWFFRLALGRSPFAAARDLAVQRFLCWTVGMTLWVGPAGWQIVRSTIGV
jgi:hypothetical protein